MNITLKRMGLAIVLASMFASTTMAFAQTQFQGNAFDLQAKNNDRNRSSQDRRGAGDGRQANSRSNNGNRDAERANQGRRDPRLSPDERRALRRQIDEAGRDIYAPRR